MARSITFNVDDSVDTRIVITEMGDGTLRFDVTTLGSGLLGDLRGLFFDLQNFVADDGLSVTDASGFEGTITGSVFDEGTVDKVAKDANLKGSVTNALGDFDAGLMFGTSGIGKDDIQSASFLLSSADGPISLDALDLVDIGLRYTSVGTDMDGRSDSEKIAGQSSGVARNDAFTVLENDAGGTDLLANDTNGVQADGTRKTVISVVDADGAFTDTGSGFERTVVRDGLELGTLTVSYDGFASFTADGADVDRLGHDAIKTLDFTYETQSSAGNLATADVTLTVDGVNDQPVAENIFLTVDEDDAFASIQDPQYQTLTGDGVTASFVASDIDIGDTLSYQILSTPTDAFGNQYGEVTNNGDGTFTFNPLDNFQFLDAGESRDVTFTYVAIDDSGVGTSPTAPEESDTSDAKTVTVTVTGSDDADISRVDQLQFDTVDQSMFGTGEALVLQPSLPFFGLDTGVKSLNATIIQGQTFSGGVLEGILGGIDAVADAIAGVGCTIAGWFGADDCDGDIDVPTSITTPSVRTEGSFDAKVGLQPYFFLTSGDVDASVPVDVFFTHDRQVENGDTVVVDSLYSVDSGATFTTMSPNVKFGMDFVFDIDTALDLLVGSTRLDLFDLDTGNIPNFEGELGEPGFNLFNWDAENDLQTQIDLNAINIPATLDLNFPVINTTGTPDAPGSDTLTSTGEDDIAVLDIDVDAVAAKLITAATGVPITFGESDSFGLTVGVAGETLNLLSVDWAWDIVAVNLITTLKAVQDFSMAVTDLPLVATLEDGSAITGFSLGDPILVSMPPTSAFDPDVDGDADGQIDFTVDVDMDALFSNDTWLGLDQMLTAGLLRFDAGITSDFASNLPSFSLFDPNGDDNGFLLYDEFTFFEDVRLATLYDEQFPIEGWTSDQTTFEIDIA